MAMESGRAPFFLDVMFATDRNRFGDDLLTGAASGVGGGVAADCRCLASRGWRDHSRVVVRT
jgi:hypothetical protein